MQQFDAREYVGKAVRLSASVKAESVVLWAGFWMRVAGGSKSLAFNNMQDRAIKLAELCRCARCAKDATGIFFGILFNQKRRAFGSTASNSKRLETMCRACGQVTTLFNSIKA
jgi:hypothetical protein